MSGSVVCLVWDKKWNWTLVWGAETFYDEKRNLRTWTTSGEAEAWYKNHAPVGTTLVKAVEQQTRMELSQ